MTNPSTNPSTTNDNPNPSNPEANERARQTAAANLLPVMLAMLPLDVVTAACEWCALYIATLAKGRDEACAMYERSETELRADVRAVCDVILVGVIGHATVDAIGRPDDGVWEARYIARALVAIAQIRERVTGSRYGECDRPGVVTASDGAAVLDVRRRAYAARRRAVAVAIVATLPERKRAEVLGHVIAWENVLGGLARAVASTDDAAVIKTCGAAAWAAVQSFEHATNPHDDVVTALSSLWHGVEPLRVALALASGEPADRTDRAELVDECDTAAGDLAYVSALLSSVAA